MTEREKRRQAGAHYTSPANILRTIGPLFLDGLRHSLQQSRHHLPSLERLLAQIASLRILDPACGCGNFLVVAYRELRRLELEIQQEIASRCAGRIATDPSGGIALDAMHGIELQESAARDAEAALALVDREMDEEAARAFGDGYRPRSTGKSPRIVHGNALDRPWQETFPAVRFDYLLGNPPFVGKKRRSAAQNRDMARVFDALPNRGELDYACCWYQRAMDYLSLHPDTTAAFVSTNSITQGEQVGVLWPRLRAGGLRIHFAHRTFRWDNRERGAAHVHVVIIGFGRRETSRARLFECHSPQDGSREVAARHINPYLIDAPDIFLKSRRRPLGSAPRMVFGSMPNDGGHLLLTAPEERELLRHEPGAKPYLRRFLGARDAIGGLERFCLWLVNVDGETWRALPRIQARVSAVREYRLASRRPRTRRLADTPHLFCEIRQPASSYIVIPRHTAEARRHIPLQFVRPEVIAGDACTLVASSDAYHFGVLSSAMHMAWVRVVAGRIKSDLRYSNEIVYNNFPWPGAPTEEHKDAVRDAVDRVLDARRRADSPALGSLYHPAAMPSALAEAHRQLDLAVDHCYREGAFHSDVERLQHLFEQHVIQVAEESARA